MKCRQIQQRLEDYLDGGLSESQKEYFDQHLGDCESCRKGFEQESKFRGMLQSYAAYTPEPGFAARVFGALKNKDKRTGNSLLTGLAAGAIAGAMAATLVIWMAAGVFLEGSEESGAVPKITFQLNERSNVHLIFSATQDYPDATIAIQLPSHLELEPYPGRHELTWQNAIEKGENSLTLPIVAIAPVSGVFTAKVTFGGKEKVFVIEHKVESVEMRPKGITKENWSDSGLV
jgi:hypothetical protein